MNESSIQAQILNAMCQAGAYALRVNSGTFWGGKVLAHTGDKLVLQNPTKVMGAPAGTSDIIGCKTITITPAMVGKQIGVFTAVEVKRPGEKPRENQSKYLEVMRRRGAMVGVARSPEDAVRILGGLP